MADWAPPATDIAAPAAAAPPPAAAPASAWTPPATDVAAPDGAPSTWQAITQSLAGGARAAIGAGEAGLQQITGAAAGIPALGAEGMDILENKPQAAGPDYQKYSNMFTYAPRTAAGKQDAGMIGAVEKPVMDTLGAGVDYYANLANKYLGPEAGAEVHFAAHAAPYAIGGEGSAKAIGEAPTGLTPAPSFSEGDLVQTPNGVGIVRKTGAGMVHVEHFTDNIAKAEHAPGSPTVDLTTEKAPLSAYPTSVVQHYTGEHAAPPHPAHNGYTPESLAAETPTPLNEARIATAPPSLGAPPEGTAGLASRGTRRAIISAERSERTPEENAAHTAQLKKTLDVAGVKYEPTNGVYMNGAPEAGFAVETPNDKVANLVNKLGSKHDQESVLHVDENGDSRFHYMPPKDPANPTAIPNEPAKIGPSEGTFTSVNPEEARGAVGYTLDSSGQHYVLKKPQAAAETPAAAPAAAPAETPAAAPTPMKFAPPPEEGTAQGDLSDAEQTRRRGILRRVGFDDVRTSAITGNTTDIGNDFQTSKLDNTRGRAMKDTIAQERQKLAGASQDLIDRTQGTQGMDETSRYARGQTMVKPVVDFRDHLNSEIDKAYTAAKEKYGTTALPALDNFNDFLKNHKGEFEATQEGEHLLRGIMTRARELGFTGESDTFNPPSVEQAERLRQFIGQQYSGRTARLVGTLKDRIDSDVENAVGPDAFTRGRGLRRLREVMIDSPKGISDVLPDKTGIDANRRVPYEAVPARITRAPLDQFTHYVNTVKAIGHEAMQRGDRAAAQDAADALNETRAHIANELHAAGTKTEGMWNTKEVNKYLNNNAGKISQVFSPEELAHMRDINDAGGILKMDRTYPGAAAQQHNLLVRGALGAVKKGGTLLGAATGHLPGAFVGHLAEKGADVLDERLQGAAAKRRITTLTDDDLPKPPTPSTPGPRRGGGRGQEGHIGETERGGPVIGQRSKQRGGGLSVVPREPLKLYRGKTPGEPPGTLSPGTLWTTTSRDEAVRSSKLGGGNGDVNEYNVNLKNPKAFTKQNARDFAGYFG